MCLIIHKPNPKSVIPQTYIDNAKLKNKDGFGIVFTDNFECFTTMDYAEADKLIAEPRPFVAHYRYATKGTIDITNCHPFDIDDKHYLFSNGTVASLGDDKVCDTKRVSELLATIPRSYWQDVLQFTDTRFAIVNSAGTVTRHGKWHKKGQIWYSKNDCFATYKSYKNTGYGYYNYKTYDERFTDTELDDYNSSFKLTNHTNAVDDDDLCPYYDLGDEHIIGVYGTLKQGNGNHDYFLAEAMYLGQGLTINKYPLQIHSGLPYLFDEPNKGHQVSVEIYCVDDEMLDQLDMLEGHPQHYKRQQISVDMDDGSTEVAWVYFSAQTQSTPHDKMLQHY